MTSSVMRPAPHTSVVTCSSTAMRSAVSVTVARSTSVRRGRLASDLARRTSPSTAAATTPGSAPASPAAVRSGPDWGHADAWTEPSCHQRHTSSATKGMNGANSCCSTPSAVRSARRADTDASGPCSP